MLATAANEEYSLAFQLRWSSYFAGIEPRASWICCSFTLEWLSHVCCYALEMLSLFVDDRAERLSYACRKG